MRVVSLIPSATDIVVSLNARDELVGVSHSCDPIFAHLPKLTSTHIDTSASSAGIDAQVKASPKALYDLDIQKLEELKPDVVIAQSLCDVCAIPIGDVEEAIAALPSKPVLVDLNPTGLFNIPKCFIDVGFALNRSPEAIRLVDEWDRWFDQEKWRCPERLQVAFLDWLDPPFAAGNWIPDMIELLGCDSVLAQKGESSHEVSWDDIHEASPDIIIAAVCGFSIERATQDKPTQYPRMTILDGYNHFSRPGPKLMGSLEMLSKVLNKSLSVPR